MERYKFDTKKYDFRKIIESYLDVNDLEKIYDEDLKFENPFECLNTKYHNMYEDKVYTKNSNFLNLYNTFIKEYLSNIINFKFYYQRAPYLRIHQKEKVSVLDYHTDDQYLVGNEFSDCYKNVLRNEINFWLPLTEAYDTNSLWVETSPNSKKFNPIKASYGDLIQFDGVKLHHGTEVNKTGQTRVSFDFRIVPKKIFDENESKLSHIDRQELTYYYNTVKLNHSYS